MRFGRAVAAAAIGITGLGLLSACDWNIATQSYSDTNGVGESFESVRFANDSGDVTIRTGDTVSVRREVHHGDEKPAEDTFRVRDGVLELDSCDKPDCWIDYEVTVPAGTAVNGRLDSGDADVSGVAEVNLRSESGSVTIKDVAGAVNVEAQSGSVALADIGGTVAGKVESGSVTAEDVRGDVTLHASSGNVEVTVPDGAYQVTTSVDSGNVDSEIENDPAGDHRLDLRADSGNISLSRR